MNKDLITNFNKLIEQIKYDIDTTNDKKDKLIHMYRLSSVKKVLDIIKNYKNKITSSSQLKDIPGVGKKSLQRIDEILETGKLKEIQNNLNNLSSIINNLDKVFGIGRSKAKDIIKKYKISSIKDLQKIAPDSDLPHSIKVGLKYYDKIKENIPRKEIDDIHNYIHNLYPDLFFTICGSYRRLKPTSNDIDIIVVSKNTEDFNKLIDLLIEKKFIVASLTSKDVKTKYMGLCKIHKYIRRIDIRIIKPESYFYALLYFTGSKEFNQKMRQKAISLNYKLNEYRLENLKNNKTFKVSSEKEIFDLLNMSYIPPELR